jgi:hypothetical protein
MNLERLLAPHLATQMPEIARFMVWLYAADILMITLTVVAVNRLGKVPTGLTETALRDWGAAGGGRRGPGRSDH